MKKFMTIFAAGMLLAGCGPSFKLHSAGEPLVAKSVTVVPAQDWNLASGLNYEKHTTLLTANGLGLDEVLIFSGVKEGEILFPVKSPTVSSALPRFRADMLPNEVMEFVQASMSLDESTTLFELGQLQPADFASQPGFDFEFSYVAQDEVRRSGRAVGAVVSGQLYLMVLRATAVHYYDALADEFQTMVASARLKT